MTSSEKIKVLIVDDSVFMRKLIGELLLTEKDIEIVGEASNGIEAVKLNDILMPDVVTMDINMPEMDGAMATKTILQKKGNTPAIIIFSAFTEEGVKDTLEGLRLGAVDFVSKPSGEISINIDEIKEELILKIKIAYGARKRRGADIDFDYKRSSLARAPFISPEAVVIGASTGGPSVVEKIITSLPTGLNAPIFVIQHMPENFSHNYVLLLNKNATITVKEAQEGEIINNGICIVAAGGRHLVVEDFQEERKEILKITHLTKEPKISGFRPSIDVLMKSVAEKYRDKALGIVLTGMGSDGTNGMRAIKDAGGYTITQSPETATIASMPLSVINRVGPNEILPPEKIIQRIIELCR